MFVSVPEIHHRFFDSPSRPDIVISVAIVKLDTPT